MIRHAGRSRRVQAWALGRAAGGARQPAGRWWRPARRARSAADGRRRGRARHGRGSARGTAGLAARAPGWGAQAGQLRARAPGMVFNLVFRLGIFPESLNEQCSL